MTKSNSDPTRHYRLELSATRDESITVSIEGSFYDCGDGAPRHDQVPPTYARPDIGRLSISARTDHLTVH